MTTEHNFERLGVRGLVQGQLGGSRTKTIDVLVTITVPSISATENMDRSVFTSFQYVKVLLNVPE